MTTTTATTATSTSTTRTTETAARKRGRKPVGEWCSHSLAARCVLSRSHLTLANRWLLSFVLDGRQCQCCRVAEWPTGYTIGDDRDGRWSTRGGSGRAVSTTTLAQLGDSRQASRRRCCNNLRRVPCSSQRCWVDSVTRDCSDGQHRLNDNVGTTWDDSATELIARLVDTTRMSVGASPDDGD